MKFSREYLLKKINILSSIPQSKNKIFEAYYNVQENDWISAKNNINHISAFKFEVIILYFILGYTYSCRAQLLI